MLGPILFNNLKFFVNLRFFLGDIDNLFDFSLQFVKLQSENIIE